MKKGARTLLLLVVFSVTFIAVLTGVFAWRRPDLRKHYFERWRYGTESAGGIVMRLEVAPTGSFTLVFTNVGDAPRSLGMPLGARTGPEIDVIAKDASGAVLEQHGPLESGAGQTVVLPPGESVTQRLPIDEYVELRPGRYEIHVERARLAKEEPRLRSNDVSYEKKDVTIRSP